MDVLANQFVQLTESIRDTLMALNIRPESYRFLFPAGKDAETIHRLVSEGVFPTIPDLAASILYAGIFNVIRFTLQLVVLKVSILKSFKDSSG